MRAVVRKQSGQLSAYHRRYIAQKGVQLGRNDHYSAAESALRGVMAKNVVTLRPESLAQWELARIDLQRHFEDPCRKHSGLDSDESIMRRQQATHWFILRGE